MDLANGKGGNKGLIIKTWERCRSIGSIGRKNSSGGRRAAKLRSKSWTPRCGRAGITGSSEEEEKRAKTSQIAPQGCFSVYVGPQKQRFVIRTECLNHPLFKMLLEEAESEYGYNCEGPLELPCEVELFTKVLVEMNCDEIPPRCSFARSRSSYHLLTPPRLLSLNKFY